METYQDKEEVNQIAGAEEDLTYFQTPTFDSVIDRYYTKFYKKIDQRTIETLMNPNKEIGQLQNQVLDQYYFVHSNKLILFGLSEQHEAITKHRQSLDKIIEVKFDQARIQNISGKRKCKSSRVLMCIISWCNKSGRKIDYL